MNEFHDPDDVLGHASHSQLPPHGLVQVLRKVAYVVAVQPGHRDTPVLRQVDVRLLRQRLALLRVEAREAGNATPEMSNGGRKGKQRTEKSKKPRPITELASRAGRVPSRHARDTVREHQCSRDTRASRVRLPRTHRTCANPSTPSPRRPPPRIPSLATHHPRQIRTASQPNTHVHGARPRQATPLPSHRGTSTDHTLLPRPVSPRSQTAQSSHPSIHLRQNARRGATGPRAKAQTARHRRKRSGRPPRRLNPLHRNRNHVWLGRFICGMRNAAGASRMKHGETGRARCLPFGTDVRVPPRPRLRNNQPFEFTPL